MNKGLIKNILIVLLLTITIFCILKYVWVLKEKYDLLTILNQAKAQVAALEDQKQNLLQALEKEKELQQELDRENSKLKENLQASKRRLARLFRDIAATENALEQLNYKYSLLKAENTALIEREKKISQENENLRARLSSVTGLKKALRELKSQALRVISAAIRHRDKAPDRIVGGNRGYIIKDGKYTYPTKVKIEVIPATNKPQGTTGILTLPEKGAPKNNK